MSSPYTLYTDRSFNAEEFGIFAHIPGWVANPADFTPEMLAVHFAKVDFVAHVRHESGLLVGYLSALSGGMGEAWICYTLAHPEFDREEIAQMMISAALDHFAGYPVYAMPFVDEQEAFRAEGFKVSGRPMIALATANGVKMATT